ncbi:heavy metal-binding domain-containing protein [Streptomyces erythrochromogenes]|uniref:heavy metal-binding domain-containing protein n=1 Tax=Streptomyces sp. gCLA4 TaxID=1873416 RepID=UPI0016030AB6|nr:heavy metal-binding domain-containing protein [Streptomyces sp. gCLA4]MBZ9594046.1 heavy metal-binding domain-containing protein [Streptomyces erythrochromogenes]
MTYRGNDGVPGEAGSGSGAPRPARTWNSGLSGGEFAAISGVGFEPVGQVLGTAVYNIGYTGVWGCPGNWSVTDDNKAVPSSRWTSSLSQLVRTMYAARRSALARAVAECGALGGDGIVGVELCVGEFPAGGLEFTVRGTAVRARSRIRPRAPFTSHLGGRDFAALIGSGWVPVGLAFGIAFAIRHDDWRTSLRIPSSARNQEVDGYTQLIGHVRREARRQLAVDTAQHGADGVVVDDVELRVGESECPSYGSTRDVTAEAVFVGTSIARFGRSGRPAGARPPLTIMRLERER